MSRYGSPGGPPYEPRPGSGDYGPPSDPWSGAPPPPDPWADPTVPRGGYPGPGPQEPGYRDQTAYQQPAYHDPTSLRDPNPYQQPAPPPRRNLGLYVTVAVLVVLAAAGVGYALYLLSGDETGQAGTPGSLSPSAGASGSPGPSGSPRDNIGMNAAMARVDDCLVNDGDAGEPQMRIVACDTDQEQAQVFQILAIFDEQVEGEGEAANEQAQSICASTEGYTHHYYEVGDATSFVLCMTRR